MLSEINSPEDLKKISQKNISKLASEIRQTIIEVVLKNGGHLASNLGVVELAIALHRVFESPRDAIVWDVGHQCYAHKILTGRYKKFHTIRNKDGLSGFPKCAESEHDFFDTGHASTSISSALGLLMARDISGAGGKVIAVIGDGALTGGMAFEALEHAGQLAKNLIVVLNDNQMSIDHNTGSVSRYLSRLTMTSQYQTVRHGIDRIVDSIPFFNRRIEKFIFRFKRALKGLFLTDNLFSDFGFEYVGPLNGHDEQTLETVLRRVSKLPRPVVVHIVTKKGRGYKPAEAAPENFHGVSSVNAKKNIVDELMSPVPFTDTFGKVIVDVAKSRQDVVAVTAAMAQGTGLSDFAHKFPERFFDVGIAEEHAVTFAGGMAKGGLLPVVCIYSTFIQRAIDQIIEDVLLAKAHIIFMLDRSGPVAGDGETHQGLFDISLMRPLPHITILSPATADDLRLCFEWAVNCAKNAVAIRYPKANCPAVQECFSDEIVEGRGVLVPAGKYAPPLSCQLSPDASRVLFVCTGGMYADTLVAARSLLVENIYADIYSLRFIKPIDEDYFFALAKNYDAVVIVEDGVIHGGIAEYLCAVLLERDFSNVAVKAFPEKFYAHATRKEILEMAEMSSVHLVQVAKDLLIKKFAR